MGTKRKPTRKTAPPPPPPAEDFQLTPPPDPNDELMDDLNAELVRLTAAGERIQKRIERTEKKIKRYLVARERAARK